MALACGDGSEGSATATPEQPPTATMSPPSPTPPPIPSPVGFFQEPFEGFYLGDPEFEALPGATALFGRLGGSIYQIEMPDEWNGSLVLYLHGSRVGEPQLWVEQPAIRSYLIRNGFAWGASSFSRNDIAVFLGSDETAALWDIFAQRFGRPQRTYVTGQSMGGGGTVFAAERYPDRFDGALGLCGIVGTATLQDYFGDYFVAGAFFAGLTQAEFEATTAGEIIDRRILPALEDATTHARFVDLLIDITGGPRPFDHQGFGIWEAWTWGLSRGVVEGGLMDNRETVYRLGPLSDVSNDVFNTAAIRISPQPLREVIVNNSETTGDIQIPLLTLHTTGDFNVPIYHEQELRRRVEAASKGDLLVQRAIREPDHCAFTNEEWQQGLEDLIAWVEEGDKPRGEDLLVDDLTEIGGEFTLTPRFGSSEADAVPGADERIVMSGALTLDGEPVRDAEVHVVVRKDGLERYCGLTQGMRANGRYVVVVASSEEAYGCGAPDAQLFLNVYVPDQGRAFWSRDLAGWPASGAELEFDVILDDPGVFRPYTAFEGTALDSSGRSLPVGTIIEAYIGETICGISSLPPVTLDVYVPGRFLITVMGPESVTRCDEHATISFRINGELAEQSRVNDLNPYYQDVLDLTVP